MSYVALLCDRLSVVITVISEVLRRSPGVRPPTPTVRRHAAKNTLTLRRLMSYIYMEHPFLMFLDHTQRRTTVGRTPLDE